MALLISAILSEAVACRGAVPAKTLFLSDFGAVANDGRDNKKAFEKALDACRNNPGTTLRISPGIYHIRDSMAMEFEYKAINGQYGEDVQGRFFKPKGEYVIGLDLDRLQDITIEADGVTIVQEGWYEAVSITNAKNVTIKGLTLTHKRPPFTTGRITASLPDYFDMEIDTVKYPYLTDKVTGRVHFYDTDKQRVYTGGWNEKKELLSTGIIRIHSKTNPKVGDICILRHCAHNRAGILIKESSDIVLEDVTIHSQPGMGVIGHRSENIYLKKVQIIPAANTVVSTNTDATHFTSCKGKVVFEGCSFGGQGDDCTNIHNYYWTICKEQDPKTIVVTVENADLHALSLDYPDAGDTLALVSKENLATIDYFTVTKVFTSLDEWKVVITLDKTFDFDPSLHYMTNLTRRPSVDIFNNTVKSHLARAFLIKTRDVRITGNMIQNSSGSAIQLGAEAGWRESGPVQNVVIENNKITGCGYGHGAQKGTVISAEVNGVKTNTGMLNSNIVIRNNVIEAVGKSGIYISDTKGVAIINNHISGCQTAVHIRNSEALEIRDNGSLPVFIE